jgi:non-canonical (house-cleaning) NTP pyrophosphatase
MPAQPLSGHETDDGAVAKVVMALAAHPFNMVVGHFAD